CFPISCKRCVLPACLWPNRKLSPTSTALTPSASTRTSRTNCSGVRCATSLVKGRIRTWRMPACSIRGQRCSGVVISRGERAGAVVADRGEVGAAWIELFGVRDGALHGGMGGVGLVPQRVEKQHVQATHLLQRFGRDFAVIGKVGGGPEAVPVHSAAPVLQPQ